ncbi:MAG: hypothetical protein L7F77_02500 [Candidatus Magnetominusculus sp. LBB02]|nr:hypothetical protein [Candidatus Magnetominusculus sp. LBB02]
MGSEAVDRDPLDDDPGNGGHKEGRDGDGDARRPSLDMIKLFARYKAGDFNEKAAREVANVFRELSDTAVTIKTDNSDGLAALNDDRKPVREDFSDLKDDFYGLKDDYFDLKDDYFTLKDSYHHIKDEYTSLKTEYLRLKDLYERELDEEKARIKAKVKSLQRRVRIYFLLLLIIVLLSSPPSMDMIYKLLGLH